MKSDLELATLFNSIESWKTVGTDTQYKILEESDETIIVFAESNSMKDWKINFRFPKTPYKKMNDVYRVHGGFLKEWKIIKNLFSKYIEDKFLYDEDVKPITIVGWSYGGALATLCLEQLWFDFPMIRETTKMVTFGAPRVIGFFNFNNVKERWNNSTMYRNNSDLITFIPFIIMGFRHVRKTTHIGDRFNLFKIFKVKKYHEISSYTESLKKLDKKVKK